MQALFHYCTVQTFHAVVSTGRVRLSSVRHANDETEGTLVAAAVARLAKGALLPDDEVSNLQRRAMVLEKQFDGMALCLSEEGDLLSQWRGYADDGRGVAIGFDRTYLDELIRFSESTEGQNDHFDISLYRAKYDEVEHDAAIKPLFDVLRSSHPIPLQRTPENENVHKMIERIEVLQGIRLSLEAYDLVYSLKHRAFSEEREWRLLHHFDWERSTATGYQPRHGQLVPYVDLSLNSVPLPPFSEVVLGPRHTTPSDVIERFLEGYGHKSVSVRPSSSPYRRDA